MNNSVLELPIIAKELIRNIKYVFGGKLRKIILYGSYARGDYNKYSDLDIMILADFDESEKSFLEAQIRKIASRASLKHGITISMLLREEKLFHDRTSILPYYKNVATEGIEIYGAEKSIV